MSEGVLDSSSGIHRRKLGELRVVQISPEHYIMLL